MDRLTGQELKQKRFGFTDSTNTPTNCRKEYAEASIPWNGSNAPPVDCSNPAENESSHAEISQNEITSDSHIVSDRATCASVSQIDEDDEQSLTDYLDLPLDKTSRCLSKSRASLEQQRLRMLTMTGRKLDDLQWKILNEVQASKAKQREGDLKQLKSDCASQLHRLKNAICRKHQAEMDALRVRLEKHFLDEKARLVKEKSEEFATMKAEILKETESQKVSCEKTLGNMYEKFKQLEKIELGNLFIGLERKKREISEMFQENDVEVSLEKSINGHSNRGGSVDSGLSLPTASPDTQHYPSSNKATERTSWSMNDLLTEKSRLERRIRKLKVLYKRHKLQLADIEDSIRGVDTSDAEGDTYTTLDVSGAVAVLGEKMGEQLNLLRKSHGGRNPVQMPSPIDGNQVSSRDDGDKWSPFVSTPAASNHHGSELPIAFKGRPPSLPADRNKPSTELDKAAHC